MKIKMQTYKVCYTFVWISQFISHFLQVITSIKHISCIRMVYCENRVFTETDFQVFQYYFDQPLLFLGSIVIQKTLDYFNSLITEKEYGNVRS